MSERYFLIGTDESYEPIPLMTDVRKSIKIKEEYLEEGESYKQAGISLVNVRDSFDEHGKYPDIMDRGMFMLSNEAYEYIIILILKRIDCLSNRSTFIRGRFYYKAMQSCTCKTTG